VFPWEEAVPALACPTFERRSWLFLCFTNAGSHPPHPLLPLLRRVHMQVYVLSGSGQLVEVCSGVAWPLHAGVSALSWAASTRLEAAPPLQQLGGGGELLQLQPGQAAPEGRLAVLRFHLPAALLNTSAPNYPSAALAGLLQVWGVVWGLVWVWVRVRVRVGGGCRLAVGVSVGVSARKEHIVGRGTMEHNLHAASVAPSAVLALISAVLHLHAHVHTNPWVYTHA